jgi:hypothetical protein
MKAENFKLLKYQSTIFTLTYSLIQNKLLAGFLEKFGYLFDGLPETLPLPDEAPSEIPRIILMSKTQHLKMEISPSRVNFFGLKLENDRQLNDFFNDALKIYETYQCLSKSPIRRLALVATKFFETEKPGQTLADYFCKESLVNEPLKRAEKFELHSYKKYVFDTFQVNSWIRFRTGEYKGKNVIAVEQDLNTLAEEQENKTFSLEEIKKFHEQGNKELDSILKKYVP